MPKPFVEIVCECENVTNVLNRQSNLSNNKGGGEAQPLCFALLACLLVKRAFRAGSEIS